ncbi:MAG: ABC transporter permease [Armatimonadetes bacterium]|nr:ABC transporter permease [Armatimonadota bacterium]
MKFWVLVPIGLALILIVTLILFGIPIGESVRLLYEGALGDKFGLHRTFLKSVPLILVGLGIVVAWRAGMFNIGGEGQLLAGVSAGAASAHLFGNASGPVITWIILAVCMAAGGLYAGVAAWLYVARGVNVVISTILLNFLTLHLVNYLVRGPLQEPTHSIPQTMSLPAESMFHVIDRQTGLHAGIFIVPVAVLLIWLWIHRSPSGFRLRLVGQNAMAARAARVPVPRVQAMALIWSGMFCGLAGGVEYLGVSGFLFDKFSPGWGFLGIPVALLGGLNPMGVVCSGLYFGALFAGSKNLEAFGAATSSLVLVMQGAAVLGFVVLHEVARRRASAATA